MFLKIRNYLKEWNWRLLFCSCDVVLGVLLKVWSWHVKTEFLPSCIFAVCRRKVCKCVLMFYILSSGCLTQIWKLLRLCTCAYVQAHVLKNTAKQAVPSCFSYGWVVKLRHCLPFFFNHSQVQVWCWARLLSGSGGFACLEINFFALLISSTVSPPKTTTKCR